MLLVGHDANLVALFKWLGVNTQPYKQPRNTPGFANYLFFELWLDSVTSAFYVRLVYHSPPVQALRDLVDPTTLPASTRWSQYRSIVEIPGCAKAPLMACPYYTFKQLLLNAVNVELKTGCISADHKALLSKFSSEAPTGSPTVMPSAPSVKPTTMPSLIPSAPSVKPTVSPTRKPTVKPTASPSKNPFVAPTRKPTLLLVLWFLGYGGCVVLEKFEIEVSSMPTNSKVSAMNLGNYFRLIDFAVGAWMCPWDTQR